MVADFGLGLGPTDREDENLLLLFELFPVEVFFNLLPVAATKSGKIAFGIEALLHGLLAVEGANDCEDALDALFAA